MRPYAGVQTDRRSATLARAVVYKLRRLISEWVNDLRIPFVDEFTAALIADVARDKRHKKAA